MVNRKSCKCNPTINTQMEASEKRQKQNSQVSKQQKNGTKKLYL